jgi:hypothetical protein
MWKEVMLAEFDDLTAIYLGRLKNIANVLSEDTLFRYWGLNLIIRTPNTNNLTTTLGFC